MWTSLRWKIVDWEQNPFKYVFYREMIKKFRLYKACAFQPLFVTTMMALNIMGTNKNFLR